MYPPEQIQEFQDNRWAYENFDSPFSVGDRVRHKQGFLGEIVTGTIVARVKAPTTFLDKYVLVSHLMYYPEFQDTVVGYRVLVDRVDREESDNTYISACIVKIDDPEIPNGGKKLRVELPRTMRLPESVLEPLSMEPSPA
ncbi:MAG: Plus-3 domain-containing protein [Acidobacteriaceae bacterium]